MRPILSPVQCKRFARGLALVAAAGALTACQGIVDLDLSNLAIGPGGPFLFIGHVGVLRGDTMRVRASYCPVNYPCADSATAQWKTTSNSVEFLIGNVPMSQVNSAQSVLVRGIERGIGVLSVAHVGSTATGVGYVHVADSSDITTIAVNINPVAGPRVGEAAVLTVLFMDAYTQVFRAAPTAWSVSDTTIVAVTEAAMRNSRFQLTVVGRAPGTTDLHVRFRDVTKVVTLTVAP